MRDPRFAGARSRFGASPATFLTSWDATPTSRPSALPSKPRLSIEVSGQPGIGKTALLRHVAHRADRHAPEGVVFAACGGQPVEDVLQFVFESLYESDIVFAPTAAQLAEDLAEPRALVVLDDVRSSRARSSSGSSTERSTVPVRERGDRPPPVGRGPRSEPAGARDRRPRSSSWSASWAAAD